MKPVVTGLLLVILVSVAAALPALADPITVSMSGSASFYNVAYSNVNRLDVNYTSNSVYPDYSATVASDAGYDDRYNFTHQLGQITAFTPNLINWSSAIINITEWSDSSPVLSLSFSNLGSGSCVSQYQSASDASLNACSSPDGSTISYNRSAGQSDYYESAFSQYQYTENWNNGLMFTYVNNYGYGPQQGTYAQNGETMPAGLQYGFDLEIQDGSTTYVANPRMTLVASGWTNGDPWNCRNLPDSSFESATSGSYCTEALETNLQQWGDSSFFANPGTQDTGGQSAVPEPGSLTLLGVGLSIVAFRFGRNGIVGSTRKPAPNNCSSRFREVS
jgi:hypothetical protein